MKYLISIVLLAFSLNVYGQNIQTQIKDALETPDTAILTKAYSKRYYLDSAEQITNIAAVRSDIEYFILDYIPSRYIGQVVEYLNPVCEGAFTEETFLNSGGEEYPVCFYYRIRQPNNPPMNPTDKTAVDVYYKVKIKVFWD